MQRLCRKKIFFIDFLIFNYLKAKFSIHSLICDQNRPESYNKSGSQVFGVALLK